MKQSSRRNALKSIAGGTLLGSALYQAPRSWTSPVVNAITLPAHAQTSMVEEPPICPGQEQLSVTVTMNDLSLLRAELFLLGGGGLLEEVTPGTLSGTGTATIFERCEDLSACYEIVFREGSGFYSITFGDQTLTDSFDGLDVIPVGDGCG